MSAGYGYSPWCTLSMRWEGALRCIYIPIGVGFCVARFTMMGNAKASKCGTSNKYRLLRLFFFMPHHIIYNRPIGEFWAYCYEKNGILKTDPCGFSARILHFYHCADALVAKLFSSQLAFYCDFIWWRRCTCFYSLFRFRSLSVLLEPACRI